MKALIVIDMQKDFVDGALANPSAQAIVSKIAAYAENFDGDLIATRDTHGEDYLKSSEGKRLPVIHCVHGTPGWEIVPEIFNVLTKRNAKLIDKPTLDILAGKDLKNTTKSSWSARVQIFASFPMP